MRILIIGGDGMLGHRLLLHFRARHEVLATLRRPLSEYADCGLFGPENAVDNVDVRDFESVRRAVAGFHPDAVINATGIVKQRAEAEQAIPSIEINALLPHRLAALCGAQGARLVHMSTDCVFSGKKGGAYLETDVPDATDIYGRSKLLGEVAGPGVLTIRTSIIGRELSRRTGLLEWFLAQRGRSIKGYRRAIFSGFTTAEMARIIERALAAGTEGLYQVSSAAISKFDLLTLIRDRMKLDIGIEPDDSFFCDRSLDSSRFRAGLGYQPPSWENMIDELASAEG